MEEKVSRLSLYWWAVSFNAVGSNGLKNSKFFSRLNLWDACENSSWTSRLRLVQLVPDSTSLHVQKKYRQHKLFGVSCL